MRQCFVTNRWLVGAVAGAIGGLAMKAVVRFVDPNAFGLSARTDANTAHAVWRATGLQPLSEAKAEQIGAAMHYAFAAGAGSFYAVTSPRAPFLRAGGGTLFGAALWLLGDELAVTLSGLEDAGTTPVAQHLTALGAHLLYGSVVALLSSQKGVTTLAQEDDRGHW